MENSDAAEPVLLRVSVTALLARKNTNSITTVFNIKYCNFLARPGAGSRVDPMRTHRHHPEQRVGLAPIPQATVVAVRPVRQLPSGSGVHRHARRQVREVDRTHRPGPGWTAKRAARKTNNQRLYVRSATATSAAATTAKRCSCKRSSPIAGTISVAEAHIP